MKQGDIVITEDNIELIAVPCFDHTAPCCGCYFYKEGGVVLCIPDAGIKKMVMNLY